jgi:hypothetical protein
MMKVLTSMNPKEKRKAQINLALGSVEDPKKARHI